MSYLHPHPHPARTRRPARRLLPSARTLEGRCLLSAGAFEPGPAIATSPAVVAAWSPGLEGLAAEAEAEAAAAAVESLAGTVPLGAVPALSSLPGARASLYLDFNGDTTAAYGTYGTIVTPAYDQDGDPTSFSDGELASIRSIWSYVSEDFAPFNLNVTTVVPADLGHGATMRVAIGGDGAWSGRSCGGLSYVGNFTSAAVPNVAFVFSENLVDGWPARPGAPRFTGDAISHEAGHGFGLYHQSKWSGGILVQPYSTGPGDGTAPLMGDSYLAARSLWWSGTSSTSATTVQDDMAVLAGPANGFGYRARQASSPSAPIRLTAQDGGVVGASGLLVRSSDLDYYSFSSDAGPVRIVVSPPASVANLSPTVSILDAGGAVLATAGPAPDGTASVCVSLPAGGTYRVVVASSGGYGNVGRYSLSGTVIPRSDTGDDPGAGDDPGTGGGTVVTSPCAPQNLTAAAVNSTCIGLTWSCVAGATGYLIEGSLDGINWSILATTAAGVSAYSDTQVAPGTTRAYHVHALGDGVISAPSAVVTAATPPIPVVPTPPPVVTSLRVLSRAPRQVVLGWQVGAGNARGFLVERSLNGRSWTTIARTGGDATSFVDASVAPNRKYVYRVRSENALGVSAPSPTVRVTTPRAPVTPRIRRNSH